ncbi:MAG: hypothetical protein HC898_04945 [Phycisphaerales bacterium]|nr:hypothetical protein [Phycisphaerales bacterium]
MVDTSTPTPALSPSTTPAWLQGIDAWMAQHPWHPRLTPYAVYGGFLLLVGLAREHAPCSTRFCMFCNVPRSARCCGAIAD